MNSKLDNAPSEEGRGDFPLEWYKLHWQHELELNKATLSYEHERLKFLAYLNGGAAGAFLTFFAAMWKDAPQVGYFTYCSIGFWVLGLCAAWWAWSRAHKSQSDVTRAYRMRRYAAESERSPNVNYGIEETHPGQAGTSQLYSPDGLRSAADQWRTVAKDRGRATWRIAHGAVFLFVLGASCAALAIAEKHGITDQPGTEQALSESTRELAAAIKALSTSQLAMTGTLRDGTSEQKRQGDILERIEATLEKICSASPAPSANTVGAQPRSAQGQ